MVATGIVIVIGFVVSFVFVTVIWKMIVAACAVLGLYLLILCLAMLCVYASVVVVYAADLFVRAGSLYRCSALADIVFRRRFCCVVLDSEDK